MKIKPKILSNVFISQIANGQDEFLLIDKRRDALDQLTDKQTGLGFQEVNELTRDEKEIHDNETYLREMGLDGNWQIPRTKLEITEEILGIGEFAIVNKGFYLRQDGRKLPVAVKTLKGLCSISIC